MRNNVIHKAWQFGRKTLAFVSAFAVMMITPPVSFSVEAESVNAADNPAFRIIAYDTSARIEIPAVENATNYRVYLSPSEDADLDSLTADMASRCVFRSGTYKSYDYVLNGDTDELNPADTISISQSTAYYFYLVTNDGSTDTLQASIKATTKATAECYWTSIGHYDTGWYIADPGAAAYTIRTEAQLAGLAVLNNGLNSESPVDFSGKAITITESLDLSAWLWTPVGTQFKPFMGTVRGVLIDSGSGKTTSCTHMIKGLHINAVRDCQGLFGIAGITSAISDIGTVDGYIKSGSYSGGIAGAFTGTAVYNCYNTGTVEGQHNVGGIAGICTSGSVIRCYNSGTVEGEYAVGGIVGLNYGSGITECYNTGMAEGQANVGGIVGSSENPVSICHNTGAVTATIRQVGGISGYSKGAVSNCYNSGTIQGPEFAGGIAGIVYNNIIGCFNAGAISGTSSTGGIGGYIANAVLLDCYNTGAISGTPGSFGGICSGAASGTPVYNCFYNKDILSADNGYGTGKTTDEMKLLAGTLGPDFVSAPSFYAAGGVFSAGNPVNGGYPVLTAFGYTGGSDIDSQFIKESSTGCYLVKNAYQLDLIRSYCGSGNSGIAFKLDGNIDLSKASYNNFNLCWQPVGSDSNPFCGTFNGGNYNVSGMMISGWDSYRGLFGYSSGTIENLTVTDVNITSWGDAGGITGYNTGIVSNCSSTGTIRGIILGDDIGGIVGNSGGTGSKVSGCSNACTVVGGGWIGGVVGYNQSTVSNCSNMGLIIGIQYSYSPGEAGEIGGITGVSSKCPLTDCHNKGTVCGNGNVGGIAGYLTNIDGEVSGCSNTGSIFGKSQVGGIVGNIRTSDILKDCYNNGAVTGYSSGSSNIGGIGGMIETGTQSCYNTGTISGGSNIGGIAGTLKYVSTSYCYNTGNVTGASNVGGIAGSSNYPLIRYSYNTGTVSVTASFVGGIIGNDSGGTRITSCYSTGTVQGNIAGGIAGVLSSSADIKYSNYWGCSRGIGSPADSNQGALPFTALAADSIKAAKTTSVSQQNDICSDYNYTNQLGADFAVSYSAYQSDNPDVAAVSGFTVTAGKAGAAKIIGTITITQNGLNLQDSSGFTCTAKTIVLPVSMPITVTQATPALSLNVSANSITVGDTLTLSAMVSDAYVPTGSVTFYNNGTLIGSTDTISSGMATINYIPTSTEGLSITAEYSGDANNMGAIGGNTQSVTVIKRSPVFSVVTAAPASPQDYPVTSVLLSTTMSNYYGTRSGQTISFYNGDTYLGDALTDENGATVCTLANPGADTYHFSARFAGNNNNDTAVTGSSTVYILNKGTQAELTISGEPSSATYGDAPFTLSPSGGSGMDNTYTYDSNNKSVLTVDGNGTVTITGAGSAVITATKAGDANYNSISKDLFVTVEPKMLNATITPNSKPYDTTTKATIQKIEYSGIVGSDDICITGGTLSFLDKTAADDKTVTASGYVLGGIKASDYKLGTVTVNHADIIKITLTVSDTAVKDKIYDRTAEAAYSGTPRLSGVLSGDSVTMIDGIPTFSDQNYSGQKIIVNFTEFTISGADANNYTFLQPNPVSASIAKKMLMVSVNPVTIDCGQTIPVLTGSVKGFVGEESESTLKDFAKPAANQNYGSTATPVDSASMAVTYSGGEATNNYEFQYTDTTLLTIHAVYANGGDYSVSGLYSLTENPVGWNTGDFTVTPRGDYDRISADGTVWASSLTVDTEAANGSVSFILKKSSDGTQTESTILYYNLDKTVPTGTIHIHGNAFKSFLNRITFDLFFKDTVDVSIAGSDNISDLKSIVYQKVAEEADYNPDGIWTSYTSFSVSPNEKLIVYARITDNAGNETVINSNGVVIYTDSTLSADSAYFDPDTAKPGYKDVSVTANLNGNTIKNIQNGFYTLVKNQDYSVDDSSITFKKEYLKTTVHGMTKFTIHFNPLAETYQSGDEPAMAQFSITELVHAQQPEFQTALSGETTYARGEAANALEADASISDSGIISYQWYIRSKPGTNGTAIEGATSSAYTPPTDTAGVFYYYVTVTNTNNTVPGEKTKFAVSGIYKVTVGNLEIQAPDVFEGAPQTALLGSISDIRKAVLTNEDEKSLTNGSLISICLRVRTIDCPQDVQNLVVSAADGRLVLEYLDISLFKYIDGTETEVNRTNSPLTITLTIPEEMRSSNRSFSMIRVYDGTVKMLTDLDDDPDTITFQSDSFSDYAIIGKDAAAVTAPKTGNRYLVVLVFILAGFFSLVWWFSFKRKKRIS